MGGYTRKFIEDGFFDQTGVTRMSFYIVQAYGVVITTR